ncbi:MAG: leucine-rich repeat protein [Bacteroidales bacterium]|nr:leucine-rich repeat protein [Clostridium sp.]MCM1202855.1 leucine-rich repeat protein [Bacteroidales bacterium]
MKYVRKTVFFIFFILISIHSVSMAEETEENGDNYCTVEDFCNHQVKAYIRYRTFSSEAKGSLSDFLYDSYWIYYDTNQRTATGKILVFGQEGDAISSLLKDGETQFLAEGYYGRNRPSGLTFTYMDVEDMAVDAFADYDIVILEKTVRDAILSNDNFLAMESLVKEGQYFLFDRDMLFPYHSNDENAYAFSYNPDTEELLVGGDYNWSGVLYNFNREEVSIAKEEISSVKILPTFSQDTISRERFKDFTNLQAIQFPENITTIGANAFENCGLTDFDFTGISGIGFGAFKNCQFQDLTLGGELEEIATEAFSGAVSGSVVLPAKLRLVGAKAFYDCKITELKLNEELTEIKEEAFYHNPITALEFGAKLTDIGSLAFAGTNITDIIIPDNVKTVGEKAFAGAKLKTVTIYSEGTLLGDLAFSDNTTLTKLFIHIGDTGITIGKDCFRSTSGGASFQLVYGKGQPAKTQLFDLFENSACEVSMHSLITLTSVSDRTITYIGEQEDSYLLTFDPGEGSMEETEQQVVVNNGEVYQELPIPKRGGYVFAGWFTDKGIEIKSGDIIELVKDMVLTAKWSKLGDAGVHTVTFWDTKNNAFYMQKEVKNGDTWDKYLEKGKSITHKTYKLIFQGWAFDDGKIIKGTDTVSLDKDITVYAEYKKTGKAKTYTVFFPEYNKKIKIQVGDMFADYDIPEPLRKGDVFLGWALNTPVADKSEIVYTSLKHVRFLDTEKRTLFAVWRSVVKNHNLTTKETLSMNPLYYLGKNNMGKIVNMDDGKEYALNVIKYTRQDEENADWLLKEICSCSTKNGMVMVLPKDYGIKTGNYKQYGIIKTGWDLETYIAALSLMDCKYFHYLRMIQTPYFQEESQFDAEKGWEDDLGYMLCVSDFETRQHDAGFAYTVKQKTFLRYYRICKRVDDEITRICRENFDQNTTVTDAMKRINEITLADYAYDNKYQIYDLNWFLKMTSRERNVDKQVDHHGVCASYSKFAFAIMAKCGYEAMPCADDGGGHSFNQIIVDGKPYYCDYTWADGWAPARYMFLDLNAMNSVISHHNPIPDKYGWRTSVSRKKSDRQLKAVTIKKAENVKGCRAVVKYGKNTQAKGYVIQYSTNRKFKKAKAVSTKKNTTTLKNLKKGKTYYVRVRPYKTIALNCIISDTGKENDWVLETVKKSYRSYGKWSKVSKVKIKK